MKWKSGELTILGIASLPRQWSENIICMPSRISDSEEVDCGRFWAKVKTMKMMKTMKTMKTIWMRGNTFALVSAISDQEIERESWKLNDHSTSV
jgi:hypothetical protein